MKGPSLRKFVFGVCVCRLLVLGLLFFYFFYCLFVCFGVGFSEFDLRRGF